MAQEILLHPQQFQLHKVPTINKNQKILEKMSLIFIAVLVTNWFLAFPNTVLGYSSGQQFSQNIKEHLQNAKIDAKAFVEDIKPIAQDIKPVVEGIKHGLHELKTNEKMQHDLAKAAQLALEEASEVLKDKIDSGDKNKNPTQLLQNQRVHEERRSELKSIMGGFFCKDDGTVHSFWKCIRLYDDDDCADTTPEPTTTPEADKSDY